MINKLILLCLAIYVGVAFTFTSVLQQSRTRVKTLEMGGGRSPAEKGVTTRNMFKNLKEKFNEASKKPGFFETGDGPADIELYCKSNRDGTQIGDDPFAQFVQVKKKKYIKPIIY